MGYSYSHSIKNLNGYIPSSGGKVTFELYSEKSYRNAQGESVTQRAVVTRVYSTENNFIVREFAETIDFKYLVTVVFKPIDEVCWDSGQNCREGKVPVSFEIVEDGKARVFTLYLEYLGNLKDYLDVSSSSQTEAGATVNVLSFKEVINRQTIKLSVTPEIETTDSENITVTLVEKPTVNTPLAPFKFSLTLSKPVAEISGVSFNAETNEYSLPITIRQKEYTYDKTNAPITPETAKFINYNLIFKS